MRSTSFLATVGLFIILNPPAANGQSQVKAAMGSSTRFAPTSSSAEARQHFQVGATYWRNAFGPRAVAHLEMAVKADPEFGFARIILAGVRQGGISQAERQQEIEKGLAAMAKAPAGEQLLGRAFREQFNGRAAASMPLFDSAAQVFPADPEVARWASVPHRTGRPAAEVIAEIRRLVQKFPDFDVNYHNLGYALFNSGDHAGGIQAMRDYARLAPKQPNSHESLAELLLRDGQNAEAIKAAQQALAVDSSHMSAWAVQADVKLNAGDVAGARAYWAGAMKHAIFSGDSLDMMHTTALSYLTENDAKTAMARLGEVATQEESKQLLGRAATVHLHMALVDGAYGDGRGVAGHLAKAQQLTAPAANLQVYSVLSYGSARQLDSARAAASRFAGIATDGNRRVGNMLNGFVALQAGDAAAAASELAKADANDVLVWELQAEARPADAAALRAKVTKSATILAGGRLLDPTILLAKHRAKAK